MSTKRWYKNLLWFVPGIILGGTGGFFYWKYFGCDGTCLITSSPVRSIIYFAVMGILVNQMFKPSKKIASDPVSLKKDAGINEK